MTSSWDHPFYTGPACLCEPPAHLSHQHPVRTHGAGIVRVQEASPAAKLCSHQHSNTPQRAQISAGDRMAAMLPAPLHSAHLLAELAGRQGPPSLVAAMTYTAASSGTAGAIPYEAVLQLWDLVHTMWLLHVCQRVRPAPRRRVALGGLDPALLLKQDGCVLG